MTRRVEEVLPANGTATAARIAMITITISTSTRGECRGRADLDRRPLVTVDRRDFRKTWNVSDGTRRPQLARECRRKARANTFFRAAPAGHRHVKT